MKVKVKVKGDKNSRRGKEEEEREGGIDDRERKGPNINRQHRSGAMM